MVKVNFLLKIWAQWYSIILLEIDLKILLRKTGARLNFKIALISLHIDPGINCVADSPSSKVLLVYHDKVNFSDSIPEEGGWIFLPSPADVQIHSPRTIVLIRMYNLKKETRLVTILDPTNFL
jgi:hypothetical protein